MQMVNYFLATAVAWGLLTGSASAAVIQVPGDFATIQGAIDAAAVKGDEIIVAQETYPEVINFNGKAINLHSASGDPADTIIDGTGLNDSVVLCISGEGAGTILEGFTITGGTGHDNGNGFLLGGGMSNIGSSPIVTNCIFSGNSATGGGGMYNSTNTSPTVTNCTFSGNSATIRGGGVFNGGSSFATITNCTFSGNTANDGGGMNNFTNSIPVVTNCIFSGNTANYGGGMYNVGSSSPAVTNCTFSGNSAAIRGGGMANIISNPTITNCTFTGNSANSGGGMYNFIGSPIVTNCIFRGDSPDEIFNLDKFPTSSTPTISFSNVQGGLGTGSIDGGGNIDVNPLFIDHDGPDNIPGTPDDDLRLAAGSPCVDAGDNTTAGLTAITTDLDGNPRFVDDEDVVDTGVGSVPIVDMGAYERQVNSCAADILPAGGDGVVDILDLMEVLNAFGPCSTPPVPCPADITPPGPPAGNGAVNIDDLVAILNAFGPCP